MYMRFEEPYELRSVAAKLLVRNCCALTWPSKWEVGDDLVVIYSAFYWRCPPCTK